MHGAGPAVRRSALERYLTVAATQRKGDLAYLPAAGQPSRDHRPLTGGGPEPPRPAKGSLMAARLRAAAPSSIHCKERRGADHQLSSIWTFIRWTLSVLQQEIHKELLLDCVSPNRQGALSAATAHITVTNETTCANGAARPKSKSTICTFVSRLAPCLGECARRVVVRSALGMSPVTHYSVAPAALRKKTEMLPVCIYISLQGSSSTPLTQRSSKSRLLVGRMAGPAGPTGEQ